ncbi:MAG: HAD-IB family hydrolase [Clostridia bacterium]|nr:HAD-IB family hydrolase [Clostridia bacterium]
MQKSYAFFDFDGTLIKGDSIIRFCFYARKKKLCGVGALLRAGVMGALYMCHIITAEKSKAESLSFLKGKTKDEVEAISQDFCKEVLIPNLYPEGVKRVKKHLADGLEVWLVSASTAFYLEPIKEYLGVHRLIGTRMHVDENGVYSGLIDGHNCRGVEKTLRIAEVLAATDCMVDYAASHGYGDTAGDIPMLMLCEHKHAVNPRKKLIKGLQGADGVIMEKWKRGE